MSFAITLALLLATIALQVAVLALVLRHSRRYAALHREYRNLRRCGCSHYEAYQATYSK